MKKPKLLADENVARQKVERLRELGFDIVSLADLGLAGLRVPDARVLQTAVAQGRVVLTHNGKDFKRLHQISPAHAGILILPDDARHHIIADMVAETLREEADWSRRLARVHRPPAA